MKLEEVIKDLHFFEIDQKRHIESFVSLPAGLATAIGGVVYSLVMSFNYGVDWPASSCWFVFFVAISVCGLMFALGFLAFAIAFYGKYEVAPPSDKLVEYVNDLRSVVQNDELEKDFAKNMITSYATAATKNQKINVERMDKISNANRALLVSVLSVGVSIFPYFIGNKSKPESVQSVKIVDMPTSARIQTDATISSQTDGLKGIYMPNSDADKTGKEPAKEEKPRHDQTKEEQPRRDQTTQRKPEFPPNRQTNDVKNPVSHPANGGIQIDQK